MAKICFMRFVAFCFLCFQFLSAFAQVKLPKSPNQLDEKGLRTGFWTILFDSTFKEVKTEQEASYYRLIRFDAGKPTGKVRDFYTSYQKQWEGYLTSVDPDVKEGEAKYFYENSQVQVSCFFKNDKADGPYKEYSIKGVLLAEGLMKSDSSSGRWTYYNEEGIKTSESEMKGRFTDGAAVYYYPNGNILSKGKMKMSKKEGPWTFYHENGKVKTESFYVNDLNNGSWRKYNEQGTLIEKGKHINEQEDGLWEYYFDNGKLKSTGKFDQGKKIGHWKYYYENGQLQSEGPSVNGLGEGEWKYYHENGKLRSAGRLTEDLYQGYWEFYFDDGQVERKGNYVRDSLDGHWLYYYHNGNLKTEANYSDNKRHGLWKYFTEQGMPDDSEHYANGKLDGETIQNHPDGSIQTRKNYKQSVLDGTFVSLYLNGKKEVEGLYVNDKREGDWNWYHNNGQLASHYYYRNGNYEGEWIEYFSNGKISKQGKARNGKNEGPIYNYYENGQLKSTGIAVLGNREGKWKFYDSLKGTTQSQGMYVKGELDGKWKFYTPQGKKDGYSYYINGFREISREIRDSIFKLMNRKEYDLALQHINWLRKVIIRDFPKKSKEQLLPLLVQAQVTYAQRDYPSSLKYYKEYGEKIKKLEGDTTADYELALNGMAINLSDLDRPQETLVLYDQVLSQSTKRDRYADDVSVVLWNKARALSSLNRWAEGEELILNNLREIEAKLDKESESYLYQWELLGSFYKMTDQYDKSIAIYTELNQVLEAKDDHPKMLLSTRRNLGALYRSKEMKRESVVWLKKTIDQLEQENDLALPYFKDLRDIGDSYLGLRVFDSARFYFEKGMDLMQKLSYSEHFYYALMLDGLAKVNYYNYETQKTLALWAEAKTLMEKTGQTNTLYYADLLQGMALTIKEDPSLFEEAEKLFLLSLETNKKVMGEFTESYRSAALELAGVYADYNLFDKSSALLNSIEDNIQKTVGKESKEYGNLLNKKGDLEYEQIHHENAVKYYSEAITVFDKLPLDFYEDKVTSYRQMASSLRRLNRLEEASKSIQEAMKLQMQQFGDHNNTYLNFKTTYGYILVDQKRYTEAEACFQDILKRTEKLNGKQNIRFAETNRDLGFCYLKKGDYVKAKNYYQVFTDFAERTYGRKSVAYLEGMSKLNEIAYDASSVNDIAATREIEKRYIQLIPLAGEVYGATSMDYAYYIKDLAEFYYNINSLAEAEKNMLKALKVMRMNYDDHHRLLANSYQLLAKIYAARDKNKEAEEAYNHTLSIYKQVDGPQSWGYVNTLDFLAGFHESMGQHAESEKAYKESLGLIEVMDGKSLTYAKNLIGLGYTYLLWTKYELALQSANEALTILEDEVQPDHYLILDAHNLAGLVALDLLNLDEAEKHFSFIIEQNKRNNAEKTNSQMAAVHNLATVYVERNQFAKAEQLFAQSKQLFHAIFGKDVEQSPVHLNNRAALYQAWGKMDEAEKYWMAVTSSWLKYIYSNFYFLSDQEKALFWAKNKSDFESFNTFALLRQKKNPLIIGEMYNNQLNTKAILLNASNKIRKRILSSQDTVLINSYHNWIESKENLAEYYTLSSSELKERNVNLDSIQKVVQGMEKDLNITSSDLDQDKGFSNVNWKDIQKTLAPNEAAVEIIRFRFFDKHMTDSVVYAALIITAETKTSPQAVVLKPGSLLEGRAFKYYKNMIAIRQRDERSYENFWSPLDPYLKNKSRIYLSLDGVYNQINLNTLGAPDGSYLVDSKNITLVSNTKDVLLIKGKQPRKISKAIATLIGHPKFFTGAPRQQNQDGTSRDWDGTDRTGIADLPGTEKEIAKVEEILSSHQWQASDFTGTEATETTVKQMQSPRLLHIATHGFFIDETSTDRTMGMNNEIAIQDPLLRSGLLFSGAADFIQNNVSSTDENGILTAYEAANLSLDNTELVVLSACETGKGEVQNGEGVYGLQRAFQTAGAKSVIMSLWKVDDEATQQLMTSFYQNWMSGQEKSVAFKNAQQELKKKFPEPYYWGAFVMTGQ